MTGHEKNQKHHLTRQEIELWQRVTNTVKKRFGQDVKLPAEDPPAEKADSKNRDPIHVSGSKQKPKRPPPPSPELICGGTSGIDKRTALRFKRGQMKIQAWKDLHDHTQEQAYQVLIDFIEDSRIAGLRCVLVITGKGAKSGDSAGVLKAMAPHWFNQAPIRPHILSFSPAQPKDGGEGAFYILLKRSR